MNAFLHGLFLGLTITISIGPGFVAIFQTSIGKGFWSGLILSTGILISDLLLISLSYLGLAEFIRQTQNQIILGLIAGCIMIGTGVYSVFKNNDLELSIPKKRNPSKKFGYPAFFKGFFLNITNPFSLIFWLTIMGLASSSYGSNFQLIAIFFTGVIFTAFGSDILKCYFSESLNKYLSGKVVDIIHKIAGIIIALIGVVLLLKVLF